MLEPHYHIPLISDLMSTSPTTSACQPMFGLGVGRIPVASIVLPGYCLKIGRAHVRKAGKHKKDAEE